MIGKITTGSSFAGTVGYVMKKLSRILDGEGVTPPDAKDMAEDFRDQTTLNLRLKNTVGHISLSFSPKDASRMTDALMTRIAKEYMQRMGITDTQYLLVRHLDPPHPHCHLVYNRVGNDGQTISDKNIKIRNGKICKELTTKYRLYVAPDKNEVRREQLREPDKTRYEIHDAIRNALPRSRSWDELEKHVKEQGITTRYKYTGLRFCIAPFDALQSAGKLGYYCPMPFLFGKYNSFQPFRLVIDAQLIVVCWITCKNLPMQSRFQPNCCSNARTHRRVGRTIRAKPRQCENPKD